MSCEHGGAWKLAGRSRLLPAFWKGTNELPVDIAIGESVACVDQLPMQLRDGVTTSFPPLCNRFEMGIEPCPSLGRCLFREGAILQPARDGRMTYSQPPQQWPFARSPAYAKTRLAGIGPDALLASPDSPVRVLDSFSAVLYLARERAESLLIPDRRVFDEQRDGARETLRQTCSSSSVDGTCRRTEPLGEPQSEPQMVDWLKLRTQILG